MKKEITIEFVEEIFGEDSTIETKFPVGDNAFLGLQIIAKYIDPSKNTIICGGGHEVIYSVDGQDLLDAGITKEDLETLARWNWSYEDEYFHCFV